MPHRGGHQPLYEDGSHGSIAKGPNGIGPERGTSMAGGGRSWTEALYGDKKGYLDLMMQLMVWEGSAH